MHLDLTAVTSEYKAARIVTEMVRPDRRSGNAGLEQERGEATILLTDTAADLQNCILPSLLQNADIIIREHSIHFDQLRVLAVRAALVEHVR